MRYEKIYLLGIYLLPDFPSGNICTGIESGELSPADYYFRTNVSFETGSPKYAWLNYIVAIGVGRFPAAGKVDFQIYAIE